MKLRLKALTLVLIAVSVLMGSIELLFSRVMLDQMASLEREQMTQHAARVQEALRAKIQSIPKRLLDWAAWDDTYEYMATHDTAYVESNLVTSGIVGLESNFIAYFDTDKKLVLEKALDFRAAREIEIPPSLKALFVPTSPLLADMSLDDSRAGMITLDEKPLLFGIRPIVKSDKSGPARGMILWARFLDATELAELTRELKLNFRITLPDKRTREITKRVGSLTVPFAEAKSGDQIVAYATVQDFFGNPGIVIEVIGNREIYQRGLEARTLVVASLLLSGVLFAIIVALGLEKIVIQRISRVARGLRRIAREDDFKGRLNIDGRDEIAELAHEINDTLEALAQGRLGMEVARDFAEAASANKSLFVSTMSHEIRTPLNGIIGMTESLSRDDITPQQREKLTVLTDCAESLLAIVNDVLDFAKIEAGKLELEAIDFELSTLLQRCINTVSSRANQKGISLVTEVTKPIPNRLVGDPTRLGQVLINLLSNAVTFTEAGSVTLRVSSIVNQAGQAQLTFAVADTGIGMTPLQKSRAFEAFNQADASIVRRYGGTGLGLSICNKILGIMQSTLQVDSSLGNGSTFYFQITLPISSKENVLPAPTAQKEVSRPLKALVVDDKESNRKVASLHLKNLGHECTELQSGIALLDYVSEVEKGTAPLPDIILLDIQMPFLSGPETAKLLREHSTFSRHRTPIVALTAQAITDFGLTAEVKALFNDWVTKPLRISELEKMLEKYTIPAERQISSKKDSGRGESSPDCFGLDSKFLWDQYGDADTIAEMWECYVTESDTMLHRLNDVLEAGDSTALAVVLHAFRSSLTNTGALELARTAKKLEAELLKNGSVLSSQRITEITLWRDAVSKLRRHLSDHLDRASMKDSFQRDDLSPSQ